jgi:hypothetical protein
MGKLKQWQLDEKLRQAVDADDLERVKALLLQGAKPQVFKDEEFSLLDLCDDVEIARLLIAAGADPCAKNSYGETPGEVKRIAFNLAKAKGIGGFLPKLEALTILLEEEARTRNAKAELNERTPEVAMTDEELRAGAMARRKG